MVVSTFVALSINPFLAHTLSGKVSLNVPEKKLSLPIIESGKAYFAKIKSYVEKQDFHGKFRDRYLGLLDSYLGDEKGQKERRQKFRKVFFIFLGIVVVLPPMLGIFKMRMLPKSNQNQIYLWVDNTPDTNVYETIKISEDLHSFLGGYFATESKRAVRDDKVIESISYWLGEAPLADFSNTFRGASARVQEHQISMRINLIDKSKRKLNSETFVMHLRADMDTWVQENYPALQYRLLEDPPGPPVRATFLLKISGAETTKYEHLEDFAEWLKDKLDILMDKDAVEDVYTSKERYKVNFQLTLDHEMMSRFGLTAQQVAYTINTAFMGQNVGLFHEKNNLEDTSIYVSLDENYKDHLNAFQYISLTTPEGKKIPLLGVAKLEPTQLDK